MQDASERAFGAVQDSKEKPGGKGVDEPDRPNPKPSPNAPRGSMGGNDAAFLLPQQLPPNCGGGESHNTACGHR